jgi:hypothetical protein
MTMNHIEKQYHAIAGRNIRVEKELLCSKTSIGDRFTTIKNIENDRRKLAQILPVL